MYLYLAAGIVLALTGVVRTILLIIQWNHESFMPSLEQRRRIREHTQFVGEPDYLANVRATDIESEVEFDLKVKFIIKAFITAFLPLAAGLTLLLIFAKIYLVK